MITVGPLVATGRTSDVYAYGEGSVVKVSRSDVPPHWAAMEAEFTAAVRRLGAPAPEVRGLVRIEGRESIVFERVDGASMWQRMLDSVDDRPALAREFADIHRAILSAGLPTDVIGSVERMCTKLSEASQLTVADRVEAQELARSLPRGAALLHGDLHPGNVLMGRHGPVVIDWFDAAIGHPITDVVRTSLLIRSDGAESPLHLSGARPDLLGMLLEVYIAAVCDILSVSDEVLQRWESVVAASRLAEGAEPDASALIALWEGRHGRQLSPLLDLVSAVRGRPSDVVDEGAE